MVLAIDPVVKSRDFLGAVAASLTDYPFASFIVMVYKNFVEVN